MGPVTPVARLREQILRHTQLVTPPLCPEIQMHLITPDCPLWRGDESAAAAAGIPWPFWGFAWAGGQALARFLLDHRSQVEGRRVLDFGSGCGIGSIAAALAGARSVLAADIDALAAVATEVNASRNGVEVDVTTTDLVGNSTTDWDVLLAGDMYYDAEEARTTTSWLRQQSGAGVRVILGDPGRGFLRTRSLHLLATYDAPSDNDPARTVRTGVYQSA